MGTLPLPLKMLQSFPKKTNVLTSTPKSQFVIELFAK